MWTKEQLAYLAGFLDGEGHISIELQRANNINRKKDYYSLRIVISNTNIEVITWLKKTFGGNFYKDKKIDGMKITYRYRLFGDQLYQVLKACYPYLIVKKYHAELLFKFRETVGKTGWNVSDETLNLRKSLYLDMKRINKPGDHS